MSISHLQDWAVATSGLATVSSLQSAASSSSVTAGSSIIVEIWNTNSGGSKTVASVSDTQSNSYVPDASNGSFNRCDVWRADNVVGGATVKITVNLSGNAYLTFTASEFSVPGNALAIDAGPVFNSGGSSAPSTGSLTTLSANTLLVATFSDDTSLTGPGPPTGFTNVGNNTSSGQQGSADFKVVSAVQTGLVGTWTTAGNPHFWTSAFIAYRAAIQPSNSPHIEWEIIDAQRPGPRHLLTGQSPPDPLGWIAGLSYLPVFIPALVIAPDRASPRALYNRQPLDSGQAWVNEHAATISQRLTFQGAFTGIAPGIMSGVPNAQPLDFALAPSGDVFFANGLIPMMKWDGVNYGAQTVGVAPPTAALTLGLPEGPYSFFSYIRTINTNSIISQNTGADSSVSSTTVKVTVLRISTLVSGGLEYSATVDNGTAAGNYSTDVTTTLPGGNGGKDTITNSVLAGPSSAVTSGTQTTISTGWQYLESDVNDSGGNPDTLQTSATTWTGTTDQTVQGAGVVPPGTTSYTIVNGKTLAYVAAPPIQGTYTAYQRFLDANGNPSNLSPISNTLTTGGASQIVYSNVQAPTDPKITRRQILRNTSGQATTYYVAVDTTDLSATTFTDTFDDETLATQTAVALFDTNGNSLANRYTVPPNDKPVIAFYLDRMFAAGEVTYGEGNVQVANGSQTVVGVGTNWTAALAGRFLYVVGQGAGYQVASVNAAAQTLTLTNTYSGPTDLFAVYAIRPAPAERPVLYFTEAGLPEAWPPTNGISLETTGDTTTGLMPADSFLYVLQRRHIYRLTYHLGPLVDGGLFLAARRGCVNNRCWVYFDGMAFLLDQQGVYKFTGGAEPESVSAAIQDVFWLDRGVTIGDDALRINWSAEKFFHAVHHPDERTVRWFVALSGDRLPRHALCYNYDSRAWWVEQYLFPVGASAGTLTDVSLPIVAGPSRRVYALGFGPLDGPDPRAGTTRAQAASGGTENLAGPSGVNYPAGGVVGSPVAIYDGRGKGQTNIVSSVSGATLRCVQPWAVQPDATSKFQLGGFPWVWDSGLFRWLHATAQSEEEGDQVRRVELIYSPSATPAQCDLRFYFDFSPADDAAGYTWPQDTGDQDSVTQVNANGDAVVNLQFATGFAQLRRSGRREAYVWKADVFVIELAGFSCESAISVWEMNVDGVES